MVSRRQGGIAAGAGETVIDVDRSHSVLGNRHVLHDHRVPVRRAQVLAAHRVDLDADEVVCGPITRELGVLAARVRRGERLALRCWCAPDPCHAAPLRSRILKLAGVQFEEEPSPGAHHYQQPSLF